MRLPKWLLWTALALGVVALLVWIQRDWVMANLYMVILEHDQRVESLQIDRVIEMLAVKDGTMVADIGAGTGVFARPFSRAASPSGKVFAVDVNPHLLEHLRETAERENLSNLVPVEGAFDDPLLPQKVDVALICDTLHHIENPDAYLLKLREYMNTGGRLAVIDFREGESPHLSMLTTEAQVKDWASAAGFELTGSADFIPSNYFLVFTAR